MKHIIIAIAAMLVFQTTLEGQENGTKSVKVTIHPLTVGGKPPVGFAGREIMSYEVDPDPRGALKDRTLLVGLLGNVPDGIGPTLRASLWAAASVAGRVNSDPLVDTSFTLRLKGSVDGPSAGGLFTVSMLAMMRGDKLKPSVTMTGTILPDGSIGAVGGVRFKMEGTKRAGIKKVLVPEYLRVEIDSKTGDVFDLEEHGKKLGLEVVFVSNIQEVYPHFTGKELAVLKADSISEGKSAVTLPDRLERVLKSRTKQRFKELRQAQKQLAAGKTPREIRFAHPTIHPEILQYAMSQIFDMEMRKIGAARWASVENMQANQWIVAFEEVNKAWISVQAMLRWQKDGFDLINDDKKIKAAGEKLMQKIFEHRDLLTGGKSENKVEEAVLDVRAFHDGLNIYSKLKVNIDWVDFFDFKIRQLREAPEGEERNEKLVETAVDRLGLRAIQMLSLLKMEVILENTGSDKPGEELDLDLLAGAFTFRGAGEDDPRPLDPEKVKKWHEFGKTRNDILFKNLRASLDADGDGRPDSKKMLLDFDNRKAIALFEFNKEFKRAPEKTPFGQVVLLAKQEVEFAFAIIREDIYGYQNAVFRGMLANARKNARNAILGTEKLNYQMYGPRYDYLRAEGLRSGGSDDQLQALRLYMSAAAVCRLLGACVKDAE